MALLSIPIRAGKHSVVSRLAALCLGALTFAAAPVAAEAACVAAALNKNGKQIRGTRSITHGVFPRRVCRRAVRHCERRLDEIRYETRRRRAHARCEIIASGPRAAEIFGPPLEGWRLRPGERGGPVWREDAPHPDDYAYRGEERYDDAPDLGEPGGHDGWRSAERAPYDDRYDAPRRSEPRDRQDLDRERVDPLIDDLLRDEFGDERPPETYGDRRNPPPGGYRDEDGRYAEDGGYAPYPGDREARSCNIDACAARYKTFRASDCTYKPTLYERRHCPL